MSYVIRHQRAAQRFETQVDGVDCRLDYTLAAGVMTIVHTAVPSPVGGRGIAAALVQAALEAARAEGWQGGAGLFGCRRVDSAASAVSRSAAVKLWLSC